MKSMKLKLSCSKSYFALTTLFHHVYLTVTIKIHNEMFQQDDDFVKIAAFDLVKLYIYLFLFVCLFEINSWKEILWIQNSDTFFYVALTLNKALHPYRNQK